ncbi:MAG: hypothetical protein UU21_C0002G0007 [Candidatus Levybacteria bacterium GW2011_GWA2_40_8]|nr:MAG: hypothetical protein UU21_C0002G0007 [Candidatus Levybacteria bacterium GW2011_GWA2_40_8]
MQNTTFASEQDFNREVVRFLKEKLKEIDNKTVKVVGGYESDASDNYILRDFTFFKEKNGEWRLYGGAQEIDVVIYRETIPAGNLGSFIKTTGTGIRGNIIIPSVIIELKKTKTRSKNKPSSSNFQSHDAISANVIARDVKRLFPRVRAVFAYDNFEGYSKAEESISFRRMLYDFDYICLNWENEKEDIWVEVSRWLKI